MRIGRDLINVASTLGVVGARNRAAYASSKGAVVLLTKSMAIDHGHENIRVNAICPGFVETDLTAAAIGQAPDPAAVRDSLRTQKSLGNLLVVSWHPANVLQAHLNLIDKKDDFRMLWF
jgi:NAD(P)-dependent dehydrogenase (short-subunit alcohol dehydrogenase family)